MDNSIHEQCYLHNNNVICYFLLRYPSNRITKDVVAFHAGDFNELVEKLQLDLHEPPVSQVINFEL